MLLLMPKNYKTLLASTLPKNFYLQKLTRVQAHLSLKAY